jgi:hypothetical protein
MGGHGWAHVMLWVGTGGHGCAHVMLWVGMGGHRSLLMGMVWVWVQTRRTMLGSDANQTHQLDKWLEKNDIDKVKSNDFWKNLTIADKQETCLVKPQTRQYMGHA